MANSNDPVAYIAAAQGDDAIIAQALRILDVRCNRGATMCSPETVRSWATLRNAGLCYEVFTVMFLDNQKRLIEAVDMFRGTVSQTSVYPREVVREAMQRNASAVILAHNHPSGDTTPSRADESLTRELKAALAMVDVRVLDHIITGGGRCASMAEMGLI